MTYTHTLVNDINAIHPKAFLSLENLRKLQEPESLKILQRIARSACCSTNAGNIESGRKLFMVVPKDVFVAHHEKVAEAVNLKDEWDYRRWMELLEIVAPELLGKYIALGRHSSDQGIREAADDYESEPLKRTHWYLFRLEDHWPNKDGIGLLPGIPRHLLTDDKVGQIKPGSKLLFISPQGEFRRLPMETFSIRVPRESDNPNLMNELPLIPIVPDHDPQAISPVGSLVYWEIS